MGDDPKDFDFDFNTPLSSTIIRPRGPVAFHALPSMHSERWRCQILIHISRLSRCPSSSLAALITALFVAALFVAALVVVVWSPA